MLPFAYEHMTSFLSIANGQTTYSSPLANDAYISFLPLANEGGRG